MNQLAAQAYRRKRKVGASPHCRGGILIVDPDPAMRQRLVQAVDSESDLTVCGETETCQQAASLVQKLNPDLVLVDASSPVKNGWRSVKQLRANCQDTKLLLLSVRQAADYANRMLQAGADGYITHEDLAQVADAIRDVLAGFPYVSEEVSTGPTPAARHELKAERVSLPA